ncbi:MAG: hypothetical protein PHV02_02410 [Rhodocyclaceae bacterium]|nr:hypothetical protein [Rhodocyclaceae bacterium]
MFERALSVLILAALSGCATQGELQAVPETPVEIPVEPTPIGRAPADIQKINALERQLAEKQRHCLVDKRRLEAALKDNQKQADELQKKLDALLAIDRELRSSKKNR